MLTAINSTEYSFQTLPIGGSGSKRYLNLPRETVATDHLRNIFTTTSYEDYDDYGNVELIEVDHNGEGTTTTDATYTNAGSFFDYLPLHTTVTNIREIEPSVVNISYSYNNNGTLSSMTLYEGQNEMFVGKSFLYDNVGNVISLSVWHPGLETRTQQISYDTKGLFPLTKTNPLLWTEEFEYDHRTGQVTKHTDANDRVTKYKYDGFGRNVVTEYADGTNRVASLQWDAGSGLDNACYYAQSQTTGSAPAKAWYDRLGREILNQAVAFDGQWVDVETQYDDLGRLWKVSEPFFHSASPTQFTVYDYDPLGRNYQTTLPTGVKLKTDYSQIGSNIITTYKTDDTQTWEQVTQTMNGYGQPVTIEEDEGGEISYLYNSMGLPKSITSDGATVTMEYDIHGNRTLIADPDAGEITTLFNAYDELTSQTDANQHTYTMTYDKLGRMTARTGEETTTWAYSTTPGHLGELTSVTASNGTAQSYSYDALGRVTSQTETVSGQNFTKSYSYDSYGRVQTENWNTGFGIMYQYNLQGYLSHVKTQNDQLIWQGQAYNARGQVTEYLRGTNLHTDKYYNTFGLPAGERTKAGTTDLYYTNYNFNSQKGNLTSRTDYLAGKTEGFIYDNLNRLTNENVYNGAQLATGFALNGNITQKSDIGTYTYGEAGLHAVTGLTNTTGSLLPDANQNVDYTAFNKASYISQGDYSYYITYGPDRQRKLSLLNQTPGENTILTKFYAFGDYEKEITEDGTRHLHYIAGGDGLAAIYVKYDNAPDSLYFILKDHLGSIVGAINDETGTVYQQNFDAWGRRRNPVDWTYSNVPDFPFDRGYTGHEHLKWFGLINMNGRMYDAALGRFLSPDLIVQNPTNTQNYNRYSYCLNNPLKYIDPSGYFRAGNSGDWWAGGDGPVFYFQGYGQEIPSGIGPGSGNHWSDYIRSEFNNYLLSNNRSFDYMYGTGASDIGFELYKYPSSRKEWWEGKTNLAQVRKNHGFWAYITNSNKVGQNIWYGTNSQLNEVSGTETILKFISTHQLLSGQHLGVDALSGPDIQLAWMFSDVSEGRAFMWEDSFKNGEAYREVAGWNTPEGLIVMNPMFNKLHESRWDWLQIGGNVVRLNGNEYWINHYEHTHPDYNYGEIAPSTYDAKMAEKYGCLILWNNSVWEIKPDRSFRYLFPIRKP